MRKRKRIFLMGVFALIGLIGCSPADVMASETSQAPVIMCSIRITAGGMILDGVLYDNGTARGFAEMLPLTVELWHPARILQEPSICRRRLRHMKYRDTSTSLVHWLIGMRGRPLRSSMRRAVRRRLFRSCQSAGLHRMLPYSMNMAA